MKILVIEYATALGLKDPSIYAEGTAMLSCLLDDLKCRDVDYLISESRDHSNNSGDNPVVLEGDLMRWLDKNASNYELCLVIAPEEEFILYKIIKKVEEKGIRIIGPNADAVMKCSNKYETYNLLKGKIPLIQTEKVFFSDSDKYKYSGNENKVVKPADGVSCSGVALVNNFDSFKDAAFKLQTELPYFIVQDFMEGTPASVSLLSNGKEALPLSLNHQDIEISQNGINYKGGCVPLAHELEDEAITVAKKAVEAIDGLRGYVGVDMILGDKAYLVEINSRLTTPYIALKEILDLNLAEAMIDSIYGKLPYKINLNGTVSFYKDEDELKIRKVE